MSEADFTDFSIKYSKEKSKEYKHKMGQYFTPKVIRDLLISKLPIMPNNPRILEPSCGSGEFIDSILEKYSSSEITGIDIDKELTDHCTEKYMNKSNVKIYNKDFLLEDYDQNYDLIITNPPYFETNEKTLVSKFKDICSGRMNIFMMFIKKSLDLLSEGGILSFVITGSILNGRFYEKTREYILQKAHILDISIVPKKMSNQFIGTNMEVIIFTLKKYENPPVNKNYVAIKKNIKIFSPDWKEIQEIWDNSTSIYLEDGNVLTGSIVWNEKKNDLTNIKENNYLLVYSHNIGKNGELVFPKVNNPDKKQYIKTIKFNSNKWYTILVNRITGSRDSIKLRPLMIESNVKFFAENHVNVIKGPQEMLNVVYEKMLTKEAENFMKKVSGNTQVSKSELLHLLPI